MKTILGLLAGVYGLLFVLAAYYGFRIAIAAASDWYEQTGVELVLFIQDAFTEGWSRLRSWLRLIPVKVKGGKVKGGRRS